MEKAFNCVSKNMAERLFYKFVAYKLLMHYNKMPTIPLFFCVKRKAPKESTLKGKGISSPFPLKYPFSLDDQGQ